MKFQEVTKFSFLAQCKSGNIGIDARLSKKTDTCKNLGAVIIMNHTSTRILNQYNFCQPFLYAQGHGFDTQPDCITVEEDCLCRQDVHKSARSRDEADGHREHRSLAEGI
eukprot:3430731-Amphidinium_carterae.1